MLRFFLGAVLLATSHTSDFWTSLRLPDEHIPYFLNNNPEIKSECDKDDNCPYKELMSTRKCWGHEDKCEMENMMSYPECPEKVHGGWAKSKEEQRGKFWKQGDFGYMKERKAEFTTLCEPQSEDDSSLDCVQFTRYCKAKNIFMDFKGSDIHNSRNRYREDIFNKGQIGGHCKLYEGKLRGKGEHKSPLQSWFAELENYRSLDFKPLTNEHCDVIFDKPTFIIKLDAGVNMYHHFCDFVNLYLSQHMNNSFNMDVNILTWDTSGMKYGDFFHDTWQAFSHHPIIPLSQFDGKKLCVKDAVFSYLARMRLGLYYNMPLIPGCHSSALMRAFSQHTLHRLNITQEGPLRNKIRITLLSRSTKFRKILNQDEIVNSLKTFGEYEVQVVDFNHKMPFLEQLKLTANSDIFMGMHGAGLTHGLFLPDWGVLFETYNCEDEHCYKDLARLRGVHYMTWERKDKLDQEDEGHHPTLGAHAKFTNYGFDVKEFLRLIRNAVEHVREHPKFQEAWKQKYLLHKTEL